MFSAPGLEIIQIEIELQVGNNPVAIYCARVKKNALFIIRPDYMDIASLNELLKVQLLPQVQQIFSEIIRVEIEMRMLGPDKRRIQIGGRVKGKRVVILLIPEIIFYLLKDVLIGRIKRMQLIIVKPVLRSPISDQFIRIGKHSAALRAPLLPFKITQPVHFIKNGRYPALSDTIAGVLCLNKILDDPPVARALQHLPQDQCRFVGKDGYHVNLPFL